MTTKADPELERAASVLILMCPGGRGIQCDDPCCFGLVGVTRHTARYSWYLL